MVSHKFLEEHEFRSELQREKKRAQRAGTSYLLIVLESGRVLGAEATRGAVLEDLRSSVRDTDVCGWYAENTALGVILTEVKAEEVAVVGPAMVNEIERRLRLHLPADQLKELSISVFPDSEPAVSAAAPSVGIAELLEASRQ